MPKVVARILGASSLVLILVLAACSSPDDQPTSTETGELQPTNTPTLVPTATIAPAPTDTPTPEPTATSAPETANVAAPQPTATNTPVPTPTSTSTPEPEPTATHTPEPTATPSPVATDTPTPEPTTTPEPEPTSTTAPVATDTPVPSPTSTSEPRPTATVVHEPEPTATTVPQPTATTIPDAPNVGSIQGKRGFSDDNGILSPYVKPDVIDGAGRKLLAIYMVGSDLEENIWAGTDDLNELLAGYDALPNQESVEVIVAFGGANKDGWRGMKFADIYQLEIDSYDGEFGDETELGAYLYQADGANMGDDSSLKLFLEYLRDEYLDFDQRFLTLWDHGNSYKGFGGDSNFNGDQLSMTEIDYAFQSSQAGLFDLIGFDACLMASVEVAKIVEPYADYMIASEELEPGHGWLWSSVIELYASEDSIVDAGIGMVDNFVQDVHISDQDGKTLSLLDLSEYPSLITALDPVLTSLTDQLEVQEYPDGLIDAVTDSREYGKQDRSDSRASVDLRHFAMLLADNATNPEINAQLQELIKAIDRFVVHSNHDGSRPNSFGIAIDAPKNSDPEYASYKVSDSWLEFQDAYARFRAGDADPPVITWDSSHVNGIFATIDDENLARVTSVYGFIEPVEYDDGSVEDFFMVVAEQPAYQTEIANEFNAPIWDQYWFTVEYDTVQETAWIPATMSEIVEEDGDQYILFISEIDYQQAGKDYSGYEEPYDFGTLTIVVHDDVENGVWVIVDHAIHTYQYLFSGPEDLEGEIQYDKATYRIQPGDKLRFWQYGFSLDDPVNDGWFEASDFLTFDQEPIFAFEFLGFEDQFGYLIDYYYALWAEDASGNTAYTEPERSPLIVESSFGNMLAYEDLFGYFTVQVPQIWVEWESDISLNEVLRMSDPDGAGDLSVFVQEGIDQSLAEYADEVEFWLLASGAEIIARTDVQTAQELPAVILDALTPEGLTVWMAYLSDDGIAIDIAYTIPVGSNGDPDANLYSMALYSFDTLVVD